MPSCIQLLNITQTCNMRCPLCYASSGPDILGEMSLRQVEEAVEKNQLANILMLSGGEPTLHSRFFDVLKTIRRRFTGHLFINSNGIKLADEDFAQKFSACGEGMEVYLQFDSNEVGALRTIRGRDMRGIHEKALGNLEKLKTAVTLVVTVLKGINDREIGSLIETALSHDCVRGLSLQSLFDGGRMEGLNADAQKLSAEEIKINVLQQSPHFSDLDFIPAKCTEKALNAFLIKSGGGWVPARKALPLETQKSLSGRCPSCELNSDTPGFFKGMSPDPGLPAYRDLFRLSILEWETDPDSPSPIGLLGSETSFEKHYQTQNGALPIAP